jgi:hypothetical protein
MSENDTDPGAQTGTGVQTPDLDEKTLKVRRRAIKDEKQAWNVFQQLVQAQDKRNKLNAEIVSRYTGKQPKDPNELRQQGREWESNFPTLFLAGIVDRIVPTLINSIDSARYLTQATLPEEIDGQPIPNRDKKIEFFRERFTQFLRRWKGWRNFGSTLCQELVLVGYCFACWTDEETIWPQLYRHDKAFAPEGAPQFADLFQFFGIQQDVLLHETVDTIQNRDAADASGWDIENCVEAVNHALPQDKQSDTGNNAREFEDLIREANQGTSYTIGAKVVQYGHLFAIEPDKIEGKGRITHMIVNRRNGKLLFERERRFDSMSDVVIPFTLEPGNGTFYGSKGIGRMLSNFATGIDLAVNDAVNQMKMAGLMVLRTSPNNAINAQIKIKSPFAIITSDATLEQQQFKVQIEAFVKLIDKLTKMAEIAVNAYVPNQVSEDENSSSRTAREASIDYTRELQAKSAFIARFAGQFADMINTIQKRACNKDSSDEDAKQFYKELIEEGDFSENEIELIAKSPAMETVQDLTGIQNQAKAQIAAELTGNPMVDQVKLLEARITAVTDPEFAKSIILPDAIDPTVEAEQVRQQLIENSAIMSGESMPVSPRDNDDVHLKVLISELKSAAQRLMQQNLTDVDPAIFDHISAGLVHGDAHVQSWAKKGAQPAELKPYQQFLQQADAFLKKMVIEIKKQHEQAKQVMQDHAAQQAQIAQILAPPNETPAGGPIPMTEKILTAWIGQYDKLPDDEKRKLETLGGLGASTQDAGQIPPSPRLSLTDTSPEPEPPAQETAEPVQEPSEQPAPQPVTPEISPAQPLAPGAAPSDVGPIS